MWKYRCKSHLIAMSVAFVVGLALSAVVFSSGVDLNSDMFSSALSQAPGVNTEALNQVLTYLQNNMWILYLGDALLISGIINIIYIGQYVTASFKISTWILIFLIYDLYWNSTCDSCLYCLYLWNVEFTL